MAEEIQINSVSPNPVSGASHTQLFTVYGANFTRNGAILLKDFRTDESFTITNFEFRSSSEIAIRPIFTTLPATWSVTVMETNGQSSQPFEFEVEAPAMTPRIDRIDPIRVPALNRRQHITITGGNFVSGCTVRLRDLSTEKDFEIRPTALVDVHQITIRPNFTSSPADWSVQVVNPGDQESNEFQFQVTSPDEIDSLDSNDHWKPVSNATLIAVGFSLVFVFWVYARIRRKHDLALREHKETAERRMQAALASQRSEFRSDLHDTISYDVARLNLLCRELLDEEGSKALPERFKKMVKNLVVAARNLENDLGDFIWLDENQDGSLNGLIARIRQRIGEFVKEAGLQVSLKTPPPGPDAKVSTQFAKNLLLIVNEVLNNILKHSSANEVIATIHFEDSQLKLAIQDNGHGMDVENSLGKGQGLANIRDRIEEKLEGRVEFQSDDNGTTVRLILPLNQNWNSERQQSGSDNAFPSPSTGDSGFDGIRAH